MAWALQAAIEESIFSNSSVAGSSMDLTKAFNLIPRDGLYCIVKRLGWPESVMKAHSSFLRSLQRFCIILVIALLVSLRGVLFLLLR